MSYSSSPRTGSPYMRSTPSRSGAFSLEQSLVDEELAQAEADGVLAEQVSFEPPMSSASVKNQEGVRIEELRDLRDALEASLANWQPARPVDAKFDEATIQDQLDDLLPPVMEDEEDIKAAEALREDQGVGRYEEIKAVLAQLEGGRVAAGGELDALVAELIEATKGALAEFEGTRNVDAGQMFLEVLTDVIGKVEQLAAVQVPDMRRLHQRAKHADSEAGAFEAVRATSDWTTEMTRQEASVFREVDEVLDATREQLAVCGELHDTLFSYKVSPVELDTTSHEEELATVHAALRRLREREAAEERRFAQLERGLDAQLAKFQAKEAASTAAVDALTTHIRKLLEDLADAHLRAWRDQKKVLVAERSISLLKKKQRMNKALAEGEEEELLRLERDVRAAAAVTDIASATNVSVADSLRDIAARREKQLTVDMADISKDRLALVERKYRQVSLSVFAAESSVEIIKQEQDGARTKKQRANAAKRPELVAAANAELASLDDKLNAELDRISTLQGELAALRDEWETTFDALSALDIDADLRDDLIPIKSSWLDLLGNLRFTEEDTLRLTRLSNTLDSVFLHQE